MRYLTKYAAVTLCNTLHTDVLLARSHTLVLFTQSSIASGLSVVVKTRVSDDSMVKICGAILIKDCLLTAMDHHSSQVRLVAQREG